MAVIVYFANGDSQRFPKATTASNRDPIFTVARDDEATRELVEVGSFLATNVRMAEVFEGETLTEMIAGSSSTVSLGTPLTNDNSALPRS